MDFGKPVTRVLRYEDRYRSEIEYRSYNFPSDIITPEDFGRPIKATLMEKTYGRNGNMNCYLKIDDVKLGNRNIILTVNPRRNYKPYRSSLDMRSVPLGTTLTITLGQGSNYIVWLKASVERAA